MIQSIDLAQISRVLHALIYVYAYLVLCRCITYVDCDYHHLRIQTVLSLYKLFTLLFIGMLPPFPLILWVPNSDYQSVFHLHNFVISIMLHESNLAIRNLLGLAFFTEHNFLETQVIVQSFFTVALFHGMDVSQLA